MRGISWLAAKPVNFSRRTLLHGVSKQVLKWRFWWNRRHISDTRKYSASVTRCRVVCRIQLNWCRREQFPPKRRHEPTRLYGVKTLAKLHSWPKTEPQDLIGLPHFFQFCCNVCSVAFRQHACTVLLSIEPSQRDVSPHTSTILITNAEKYQISHIKKHYDCRHGSVLHVYNLSFEANNLSK